MKTQYLKFIGIAAMAAVLASCSQDFLERKQNYDNTTSEIYNSEAGIDGRVRDIYARCLPNPEYAGENWQYVSWGLADNLSAATEEYNKYGGNRSVWTDADKELTARGDNTVPDYFIGGNKGDINSNSYGLIRHINEAIAGVQGGNVSTQVKEMALGQLYFFRAWRYFLLWKWYGGVPKVDVVLEVTPNVSAEYTQRKSAKEIYEFIINDLRTAADLLGKYKKELIDNESNYGRVNQASALALKGRVMTWWCSPLFNRNNEQQRYQAAYDEMLADLDVITNTCGYHLYPAQTNTAAGWADMFQIVGKNNSEAIFFARLNNLIPDGSAIYRTNTWEGHTRPWNSHLVSGRGNGLAPTSTIVDIFPMEDGKVPTNNYYTRLSKSTYTYNDTQTGHSLPFLHRDPRFYRTFGFPGVKWPVSGSSGVSGLPYPDGADYELWNYVWYDKAELKNNEDGSPISSADYLTEYGKGMYITKRSGSDLNHQSYILSSQYGFRRSYASLIEIRYAEVLLNLAEVACGANKPAEAVEYLRDIRRRVGYDADCGITATSQPDVMAAVLYERQIELAYEGKRFDDMRRWLLFDGGGNMPGNNKLQGWGGNTCDWLGVKQFNGTRREAMEFRVNDNTKDGLGGKNWATSEKIPDPIAQVMANAEDGYTPYTEEVKDKDGKVTDTKYEYFEPFKKWRSQYAVDLNVDRETLNLQLEKLETFYKRFLTYKFKHGDVLTEGGEVNASTYITYRPKYYFLGLHGGSLDANPTIEQTVGWDGGPTGNGDFDPLD